jgi:hypothetical protein
MTELCSDIFCLCTLDTAHPRNIVVTDGRSSGKPEAVIFGGTARQAPHIGTPFRRHYILSLSMRASVNAASTDL